MPMFDSYPFSEADARSDRWKRILAWLTVQGAPEARLISEEAKLPGHGPLIEYNLVFSRNGVEYKVNAGLAIRGPALVLTDLKAKYGFGNPAEATFFDYVREVPDARPGTTPLPPQPDNPIGKQIEGDPDSYYTVPGDQTPNGYIYSAPDGTRYIKRARIQIGGLISMWWDRFA